MRRLVPDVQDEELDALYADVELLGTPAAPTVSLGMVASTDGAATIRGHTAELGGPADRVAFRALRGACDAILVGAGTVRAEGYGPPARDPERRAARSARGLAPRPLMVVVTRTLALDPRHRLFSDPEHRPLVVTHSGAPPQRAEALAAVAEVVRLGTDEVDLRAMLAHLGERRLGRILCEGGPTLNAALLGADLVDDVFLTVAPVLVGGAAPRIVAGPPETAAREVDLVELREHEGELLARYRRRRAAPAG